MVKGMGREEWRDIPGYEGLYQVSNHGRVKSLGKYIKHWRGGQRLIKGRILKPGRNKEGYLQMGLSKKGKIKYFRINRLVLTAFDRPPKKDEEGNHKDGNKANNYRPNLEWCTSKENHWHKNNIIGKHNRGERHGRHKLTEQDVKEIKVLLKEGKLTQQQIADKYCVKHGVINKIKLNRTWKHIK